jgi:modification methylase
MRLRQHIIWDYCATPDVAKNKFYPFHEDIFYFSKGKPAYFNEDMAAMGDIWRISVEQKNQHPAPFPLKLAKRCISASCPPGGLVYDPFMGSGTTALAAIDLGMEFIGTEISEQYCTYAQSRINIALNQTSLF